MSQNRRSLIVWAFVGAMAMGLSSLGSSVLAGGGGGGKEPRLEGILVSMTAPNTVVVRLQNRTTRTLTIPATAKVERNGVRVPLTAFKVGDRVQARFTANGATVTKFEGVGP